MKMSHRLRYTDTLKVHCKSKHTTIRKASISCEISELLRTAIIKNNRVELVLSCSITLFSHNINY